MSNTKELKDYLIDDGFLLDDMHNGKTIMLSGAWGSGKTHFWQNEIERKQEQNNGKDKFTKEQYQEGLYYRLNQKNKACVYVSLYGKESIAEIKYEIFREAYNSIVDEDFISKSASFLSTIVPTIGEKSLTESFEKLNQEAKEKKSKEILQDGSIICLDDFERKSKKVDLNDLFGLISHLAIEHNCKLVIILNSDVFEGEEANVFRTVKEKTVNKFFYFKPTINELFNSIYGFNKKYQKLDEYKEDILNIIEETEELNARIYIQVLDNCWEWLDKGYDMIGLRTLVLNTVCFIQNHFILSYFNTKLMREPNTNFGDSHIDYDEINFEHEINNFFIKRFKFDDLESKVTLDRKVSSFFNDLNEHITGVKSNNSRIRITSEMQKILLDEIDEKFTEMQAILKFGYKLFVAKDISETMYKQVSDFIESGILSPKENL